MDWTECINKRIVKDIKLDSNLIKSARKIALIKIESADVLQIICILEKSLYFMMH